MRLHGFLTIRRLVFSMTVLTALPINLHAETKSATVRFANTAVELERERLANIVKGIDQLLVQVDQASSSGAGGRVQFNYDALRRDLLSRRELIQRYVNSAWDAPRTAPAMATSYNR